MPLNIASATLTQNLPANALVRTFTVNVRADAAGSKRLSEVGQVRSWTSSAPTNQGGTTVVVDFGNPLTVSGAAPITGKSYKIVAVYRWQGTAFDFDHPVFYGPDGSPAVTFPA